MTPSDEHEEAKPEEEEPEEEQDELIILTPNEEEEEKDTDSSEGISDDEAQETEQSPDSEKKPAKKKWFSIKLPWAIKFPWAIKLPWVIAALTILGLLIRIALIYVEKQVYVDGIHYLLQGENIRSGIWDTWDPNGGRWTVPQLLPIIIAFMRNFTSSVELAGRLGSVLVSISIIPGLYLITRELAGEKGGRWAAFIAAVDPLLAHYSIVTYAEPVFFTMMVWAVWFSIRMINSDKKMLPAVLMGIFVALSYLAKAFGLVAAMWGLVILLYYTISAKDKTLKRFLPVGIYVAAFLLITIPYWIFLFSYTGHFAVDGKSQFQFTRLQAPTLEMERVDPRYEGAITEDYEYAIYNGEPLFGYHHGFEFVKNYAKKYVRKLIEIFIDYPIKHVPPFMNVRLTTPLFLMLLGIGLFSIPLSLARSPGQRILMSWLLLWLIIAPMNFIEVRYFVPIVPLLVPFVAIGVLRLEDFLKNTLLFKSEKSRILVIPLTGLIILSFGLPSLTYKFTHPTDPDVFYNEWKLSGEFMRDYISEEDSEIVEFAHMTAYYAGMQGWVTPATDYDGLVQFMLKHDIKYFAMDKFLPLKENKRRMLAWLFHFPPEETTEFKVIYYDDKYEGHNVIIYELKDEVIKARKKSEGSE